MAKTYSNMMPLGTTAPTFSLINVSNNSLASLEDIRGKVGTLIMFICNHCPFVVHMQKQLSELDQYLTKGIGITAISANDVAMFPQDSPENMRAFASKNKFSFPYLYDEDQSVAKAYNAACTPDFFLFDEALACYYRGRFDPSTPGNGEPVTGIELRSALDSLLAGKDAPAEQHPSMGCNIKWK